MSSIEWLWDYASKQYVRWSKSENCYINQQKKRVKNPQLKPPADQSAVASSSSSRTTHVPSQPVNVLGRTSSSNVTPAANSLASLDDRMRQMTIGSPSGQNVHAATLTAAYSKTARDPLTGAETRWERSQPNAVTGSSQRSYNPTRIRELEGQRDQHVLKGYSVSRQPQSDYRPGRVVEVLLVPPESTSSTASGTTPREEDMEAPARTIARLRRFVIVRETVEGRNAFEAIAIKTYNGQGVAASGVIKHHHTIIYTGKPPNPDPAEQPQRMSIGQPESGMLPSAIRVVPYDRGKALDPMARLDYGDRYVFDHGVPNSRLFGRVHDNHLAALFLQYNQVWASIQRAAAGAVAAPTALPTAPSTTTEVPAVSRDFEAANSGPISDEQMRQLLRRYLAYADRHEYQMPAQKLNANQIHGLARDSEARATYFQRVRASWRARPDDEELDGDDSDSNEDSDDH